MLRLVGAVLLAMGPTMIGFYAASRLARRPRILRELIGALEQMEREITFRLTPLPELFAHLAQTHSGPVGRVFSSCTAGMDELGRRPISEIWRKALDDAQLDVTGRARKALEELGDVLGQYDEQGLRGALEQARAELSAAAEQAEQEREQKGRMDQVLGLTTGALLVILLI